jgi:hypothetical protein
MDKNNTFYCFYCFKNKSNDQLHGLRNKKQRCISCATNALSNLNENKIVFLSKKTGPLTRKMRNDAGSKYYLNGKFLPQVD